MNTDNLLNRNNSSAKLLLMSLSLITFLLLLISNYNGDVFAFSIAAVGD